MKYPVWTLSLYLSLGLCACASAPQTVPPSTAQNMVMSGDAPDRDYSNTDIIIAKSEDGIGASWSSITDSPLARTATELSNLGGAPIVAGAVGAILVADAAPKGRASRLSMAMNADIDPATLDADLEQHIAAEILSDEDPRDRIRVAEIEDIDDLPQDAFIVSTAYVMAKDGSALRVTADVAHSADIRLALEVEQLLRERELAQQGYGTYRYSLNSRRERRLRNALRAKPHYRGSFEYHSEPVNVPTDELEDAERKDRLIAALDAERDARKTTAQNIYDREMEQAISERRKRKAERRLSKALDKADKLHAKSIKAVGDGELSKMERLVLGMSAWQSDGTAERLFSTVEEAHAFIAKHIADRLSGDVPPTGRNGLIEQSEDGRMAIEVADGRRGDLVMSLPEDGAAEYGSSVATP